MNDITTPTIELAVKSMNASSRRDIASVMANSEREEQPGVITTFEKASERNDIFYDFILTDSKV